MGQIKWYFSYVYYIQDGYIQEILASVCISMWIWIFLLIGAATCVWFIFWMMSVYNFPAEHPRISRKELNYIEASLTSATANKKVMSLLSQSFNDDMILFCCNLTITSDD